MNSQKKVHLASRGLNVLEPDPAEERDDRVKADRSQIGCDVWYPVSSNMLNIPAGSAQGDVVENSELLLWLLPGNLEGLGHWEARQTKLLGIGMMDEVHVGA